MAKTETTDETADEIPGRWHVLANGTAHLMKSKTTTLCGAKDVEVVDVVGTIPEGRRPPCAKCAAN